MKIKWMFILTAFLSLISGCASAPKDLAQEIYARPDSAILKTETQALKDLPKINLNRDNHLSFDFGKDDPLLLVNGKRAPVKVLEIKNDGTQFFVVSSVIRSAGWRKDALVIPQISFYKDNVSISLPKIKQIGIDRFCGLDACLVTTYDLGSLPKGIYRVVLSAYVDNADQPIQMRNVSGM